MKKIKVFYWLGKPNFGDALNIDICRKLFDIDPIISTPEECEATFIGSTLDDFLYNLRMKNKYKKYYYSVPVKIWGSGFITDRNKFCYRPFNLPEQYFRRVSVYALRGELSLKRLEAITSSDHSEVPLADPGLLVSDIIDNKTSIEKKYKVGIIPHFLENDLSIFKELKKHIPDSVVIDMTWDTMKVIHTACECEVIISSALHGLILADSLRIPNIRIKVSNKVNGGDFKYRDYYSGYGIYSHRTVSAQDLLKEKYISSVVRENYSIDYEMVKEKKRNLYAAFPYKI